MMRNPNRTTLPELPDPANPTFGAAVKEVLELLAGRRQNADVGVRMLTVKDLEATGMLRVRVDGGRNRIFPPGTEIGDVVTPTGDGTGVWGVPEKPSGVRVTATRLNIVIEWNKPGYPGHWRTEIWRSESNDIGQAMLVGTTRARIYGDLIGLTDATRFYWLRHVNLAAQPGPYHAGPTDGATGTTGKITDSDIDTISADRIVALTLSAISANLGSVVAGNLQSPDGTFEIDLDSGSIIIAGPAGKNFDHYMILTGGRLEFYRYTGSGHVLYKAVKHRESGVCNSGDIVTIPGYFDSEPDIVLSPRRIRTYDQRYPDQHQTLELIPTQVDEYLPGQWQFTASAKLLLAGGTGGEAINYSSGAISGNTHTSDVQTTPDNTTQFTAHVRVASILGTGTAPNYRKRQVRWRVKYRRVGDSTWLFTAYTTTAFGASFAAKTATRTITGLSGTDAYEFAVEYISENAGGTFASGTAGFQYSTETLEAAGSENVVVEARYQQALPRSTTSGPTLPASALNPTWEIYQLQYSWKHDWEFTSDHFGGNYVVGQGGATEANGAHSYTKSGGVTQALDVNDAKKINGVNLTYDRNYIKATVTITSFSSGMVGGGPDTIIRNRFTIREAKVVIKRRTPTTNSTTPQNTFEVTSYDYTLSAGQTLATGTLNWIALGE